MPASRRVDRCVFKHGGRRCVRSGTGNPPLCHPHKVVFADQARRAARASSNPGAASSILEDLLHGRMNITEAFDAFLGEIAASVQESVGQTPPRSGPFRPPAGYQSPPNWQYHRQQQQAPVDPAVEQRARARAAALATLDLTEPITAELVNKRRRELARQHHPDRGGSVERMARINDAADILLQAV